MTEEKIARINELYKKSKAEGLTEEEAKEQHALRQEYLDSVRKNLRSHQKVLRQRIKLSVRHQKLL